MTKTSTKERIIYGAVAVFMLLSTVGMYIAMVLSAENPQPVSKGQQAYNDKKLNQYLKKLQERSKWIDQKMSEKYYPVFSQYKDKNKTFDAKKITKLEIKDLKIGNGKEIKDFKDGRYYYIGWLSNGKIFDSSFKQKSLKRAFSSSSVIEGWSKGIVGIKEGGIRELTVPAKMAYGDKKNGEIPANSPLKFIVFAVPQLSADELKDAPKVEF